MRLIIAAIISVTLIFGCSNSTKDTVQSEYQGANDTLYLGGGCFWCVEALYEQMKGVKCVESGYANCISKNEITYEAVCKGNTGCAEVVKICYDSNTVAYTTLLSVFFKTHDPTTLNKQGYDEGTQYRSGIYHNSTHKRTVAQAIIDSLTEVKAYDDPIVTEIMPLYNFYMAEKYHQDYYKTIQIVGIVS